MQQTPTAVPPSDPASFSLVPLHKAGDIVNAVLKFVLFTGNPAVRLLPSTIANRLGPATLLAGPVFWLGVVGYATYRTLRNRKRRRK